MINVQYYLCLFKILLNENKLYVFNVSENNGVITRLRQKVFISSFDVVLLIIHSLTFHHEHNYVMFFNKMK